MEQPSGVVGDAGAAIGSEPLSVDYEYTVNWAPILRELGSSLLISTYQAGKVVVVSPAAATAGSGLRISCHNFEKAMGIAVSPDRLAVVARSVVWTIPGRARHCPPARPRRDLRCLLPDPGGIFTGTINGHELARADEELWMANTLFSCLCTLDDRHSFIPRWRPAVHHGVRRAGQLPPQCDGHGRGKAALCDRIRDHRRPRRLGRRRRGRSAAAASSMYPRARSSPAGWRCRIRPACMRGPSGCSTRAGGGLRPCERPGRIRRDGRRAARLHPRPGDGRDARLRGTLHRAGPGATFGGLPVAERQTA